MPAANLFVPFPWCLDLIMVGAKVQPSVSFWDCSFANLDLFSALILAYASKYSWCFNSPYWDLDLVLAMVVDALLMAGLKEKFDSLRSALCLFFLFRDSCTNFLWSLKTSSLLSK